MQTLHLKPGTGLVVVAHPDDETIWMGGILLLFPKVKWTIFSLCRKGDRDRAPKFKRACARYRARAVISDLEDEGIMNVKESIPEIAKKLKRHFAGRKFNYLFTHGIGGEYGHPRHKGVYRATRILATSHFLQTVRIFYFSYELDEKKGIAVPKQNTRIRVRLPSSIWQQKRDIIKNIYGFSEKSFEYRSCAQVETFLQFKK